MIELRPSHPRFRVASLLLLAFAISCGDSATDTSPVASGIEIEGIRTDWRVGENVTITARLVATDGSGLSGVTITLTSDGGVTFVPSTVTTGSDGRAEVSVTLPTVPGSVTVTASGAGFSQQAEIDVLVGPAATLAVVSGDLQTGTTGQELAAPLVVLVTDAFENPVPGETVTFEGIGGATPASATGTTDAQGQASTAVTLGPEAGTQGVTASSANAGQVAFSLTSELAFASIAVTSGDATLTQPYQEVVLSAEARDANGAALSGVSFTWTTSDPAVASVDADGTVTALKDGSSEMFASAQGINSSPVTITVAAGVVLDRAEAIAAARAAVVDPAIQACFAVALAPERVLATGSTVAEGIAAPGTTPVTTMTSPTWFMMLDLAPFKRWGHAVQYLFVNAATGAVTVQDALSPPLVDGELHYVQLQDRIFTDDRFEPATLEVSTSDPMCEPAPAPAPQGGAQPAESSVRPLTDLQAALLNQEQAGNIVGVVINGGHPPQGNAGGPMSTSFDRDAQDMTNFLEGIGASVTQYGYRDHQLLDVINGIRQLGQTLGPDDKLVIYYVGHGLRTHLAYGSGTPNQGYLDLTDPNNEFGLQALLESLPVGTINVALDACYSGSAITEMTSDGFEPGLEGATVSVFAGADRNRTGNAVRGDLTAAEYDDWKKDSALDPYRDQAGFDDWFNSTILPRWQANTEGTFTQNFLTRVRAGTLDTDGNGTVSIPELETSWGGAQTGVAGMTQMPPGTGGFVNGSVSVIAEDIGFEHVVSSSPCPQPIGTVTLTNSTSQAASWSVSTGGTNLAFAAPGQTNPTNGSLSGSLQPGQSIEIAVHFNCGQTSPFTQQFTTSITAGDDTASATATVTGNVHF